MMNDLEEPRVKSILMLPNDLVLNCLARVSRFEYPSLSLVSKRFHSLIASTELYQTRTLLGRTESCIYVCLKLHASKLLSWFILNTSKKVLVPIPSPQYNFTSPSTVAVVGTNIYVIGGGGSEKNASSSVMVMDTSRPHVWLEAPSMRVARVLPSACTLDGKIYITGGCENIDSNNWMEVFDTKSKTWEFLQIPSEEICKGSEYRSISYQGTVYVRSEEKKVTYKVHKGKWREADICMNKRWGCSGSSYCVIEDVFYCYCDRKICWYDLKERIWKPLKCCLEGLPRLACDINRFCLLADHGGRLAILWQEYVCETKIIWCAEIALERRQNLEIWGKIEWHGNVVSIPTRLGGVHALTSTVW